MKKAILLIAIALLFASAAPAQKYNWAVGARIGGEMAGVDMKYNFNASRSVEAMLTIPYNNGFMLTGLYEWSIPVICDGFRFYYGAGAQLGAWKNRFAFGIDGIVGLEYQFPTIPLNLALDYKPIFNIAERTKFYMADVGLSIRVAF